MTGINEVAKEIHENARAHGWWDEERGFPEVLALIHSEVSEALEEYRNGHGATEIYFSDNGKPEGIPTELADVIIRVLDYCGYAGIDIDAAISQKHEYLSLIHIWVLPVPLGRTTAPRTCWSA